MKENKYKNSPKITFGYRREQNNSIFACGCTSDVVGPGSYNGKLNALRFVNNFWKKKQKNFKKKKQS